MNFEEEIRREIKIINDEMDSVKEEMGKIRTHIAEIKVDVNWIKKFLWVVIASSVAAFIATLIK